MAEHYKGGDKVFAKIRGYPPWPARVDGIADSTPNNAKYHVFFYGTLERGVCRYQDLFPYLQNKQKFMKSIRRKGYKEAMDQIEGVIPVPQLVPLIGVKCRNGVGEKNARGNKIRKESNLKTCEKMDKKRRGRKRKSDMPVPIENNELVQNNATSISITNSKEDNSVKEYSPGGKTNVQKISSELKKKINSPPEKVGCRTLANKTPEPSTSQSASPLVSRATSRSGRVLKRKIFADEITDVTPKKKKEPSLPSATPSQKKRDIKSPQTFDPLSSHKDTKRAAMENILCITNSPFAKKQSALEWLATENCMTRLDTLIRGHLGMSRANTQQCIDSLENMCNLKLKPLMLKKHPEVVETIKRLRKYVGNASAWNFSEEQRKDFEEQALKIRSKAQSLFDKFKTMFSAPDNSTFLEIFADSVLSFQRKTEEWPLAKIYALTSEPKEKKAKIKSPTKQQPQKLQKSCKV